MLMLMLKVPAYVAEGSDSRLMATGTSEELDECADKLARLGASLARDGSGKDLPKGDVTELN